MNALQLILLYNALLYYALEIGALIYKLAKKCVYVFMGSYAYFVLSEFVTLNLTKLCPAVVKFKSLLDTCIFFIILVTCKIKKNTLNYI